MLKIYNTLSRTIEPFKPIDGDKIKLYACGPTVYNFAHIGNLCAYTFEDIVIRTLRFLGYEVETLMNLTDIDDKTIRDSQKEHTTLKSFTQKYTELFFEDLKNLGIKSFDRFKPISELVPEMIVIIQKLLDKKHAYISDDGSIYFDIKSFKKYGNLAHLDTKGMKAGARVNQDEYDKESLSDFALWKGYVEADGGNFWNAEFEVPYSKNGSSNGTCKNEQCEEGTCETKGAYGHVSDGGEQVNGQSNAKFFRVTLKGRPGWHIECSACNLWGFGEQIDIHMGGCDLIFPHHQNEIAQTESLTGKTFSNYWMHSGHLLVDGKKMSKSAGNFYRLHDLEERYLTSGKTSKDEHGEERTFEAKGEICLNGISSHGSVSDGDEKVNGRSQAKSFLVFRAFRMMCLQNRYRENFNFTFERLESGMATITNLDNLLKRLKTFVPRNTKVRREFRDALQEAMQGFVAALEDDIDTVVALVSVFDFIKIVHQDIDSLALGSKEVSAVIELLKSWDSVMGVMDWSLLETTEIPTEITELAQKRVEAKLAKDFALADSLRKEVEERGYNIVDTKDGPVIEKK